MKKIEKPYREYIGRKRKHEMKEIAEGIFQDAFLSIDILPERIYLIRVDNSVDIKTVERFTERYSLCKVQVFPRVELTIFRGKKQ